MSNEYVIHELFVCNCEDISHQLILTTWDFKDGDITLDLSIRSNIFLPFYRRIWISIKYILGIQCNNGFDTVILKHDDVLKLQKSLEEYLKLEADSFVKS